MTTTQGSEDRAKMREYIAGLSEPEKERRRLSAKISYYRKFLREREASTGDGQHRTHRANFMTIEEIRGELAKCRARIVELEPERMRAKQQRAIMRKIARAEARVDELKQGLRSSPASIDQLRDGASYDP